MVLEPGAGSLSFNIVRNVRKHFAPSNPFTAEVSARFGRLIYFAMLYILFSRDISPRFFSVYGLQKLVNFYVMIQSDILRNRIITNAQKIVDTYTKFSALRTYPI